VCLFRIAKRDVKLAIKNSKILHSLKNRFENDSKRSDSRRSDSKKSICFDGNKGLK
jgi:hypothetical protein